MVVSIWLCNKFIVHNNGPISTNHHAVGAKCLTSIQNLLFALYIIPIATKPLGYYIIVCGILDVGM